MPSAAVGRYLRRRSTARPSAQRTRADSTQTSRSVSGRQILHGAPSKGHGPSSRIPTPGRRLLHDPRWLARERRGRQRCTLLVRDEQLVPSAIRTELRAPALSPGPAAFSGGSRSVLGHPRRHPGRRPARRGGRDPRIRPSRSENRVRARAAPPLFCCAVNATSDPKATQVHRSWRSTPRIRPRRPRTAATAQPLAPPTVRSTYCSTSTTRRPSGCFSRSRRAARGTTTP